MTRVPLAEAPEALEQWLRTLAEAATPTATTVAICGAMDVILAVEKAGIPSHSAAEYNRAALRFMEVAVGLVDEVSRPSWQAAIATLRLRVAADDD